MPVDLAMGSASLHEHCILSLGRLEGQLVKGDDLSSSLDDPCPSTGSYPQGTDLQLGQLVDADVIGDGANDDCSLALPASLVHVANHTCKRHGNTVAAAHEEPLEDDVVEFGICTSCQKPVELHQQSEVDILTLGFSSVDFP